jgi:endonuclease-3
MTKKNNIILIQDYLEKLFEDPKCELNYNKDYELLIAIVLSAQTTDKRVNSVTKILFDKYDSLEALSKAKIEDIGAIIKPIGTFNKKSQFVKEIATILVNDYKGVIPTNRNELIKLPGVGRKTANVFLGVMYNIPGIAVDTHVNRVSKRLGLASENDDVYNVEKKLMKLLPKDKWVSTHHRLVLFGRYYCKSMSPKCEICELKSICQYYNSK